jgi:hypothetical protein
MASSFRDESSATAGGSTRCASYRTQNRWVNGFSDTHLGKQIETLHGGKSIDRGRARTEIITPDGQPAETKADPAKP